MFLTGLGTAVPRWRYRQSECWDAIRASGPFPKLRPRSQALLRKVLLGNNGIETRHASLSSLAEAFDLTPDTLHERFAQNAPTLAAQAAHQALGKAGFNPGEIQGLVVSTCTGYLCPGLSTYLVELLELPHTTLALDVVGHGCGAAIPNLQVAEALIRAGRCERILSVCVEVCSAAFFLDDDPGVLISACLFGDGAAAAVLTRTHSPDTRRVEWRTAMSIVDPSQREQLRFELRAGMLRNVLRPQVPALAARYARAVFERMQKQTGLAQEEIAAWIWHAGGRDVLAALGTEFGLSPADLAASASVLRRLGNISSPFVWHVLQETLETGTAGGLWWMGTFGAGFSSYGVLWQVE